MLAMATSPTQLSLRHLRNSGLYAEIVEHYNCFTKRRHDLFGFADIIALGDGMIMVVQTTTRSNIAARIQKIRASDLLPIVLKAGIIVEVHGWRKEGARWRIEKRRITE